MRSRIFTQLTRFCRKLLQGEERVLADPQPVTAAVTVTPRAQHPISREQIDPNAIKVLDRLHHAGYQAYLVGGGVRDLLLGQQPKDFDITTDATPEQVQLLFRNCRLVGRRFRLAHVIFGHEVVEVATFRADHTQPNLNLHHTHHPAPHYAHPQAHPHAHQNAQGRLLRDNVYGTLEQDAQRRDFTINCLYYNIADLSLYDYTGGLADLRDGVIRLIGDAESRYREDPVRMLRAVRFAAKLQMHLSDSTAEPISHLAPLLAEIPAARLFEESLKLLQNGCGYRTYQLLCQYQLFAWLFPQAVRKLNSEQATRSEKLLQQALQNCDQRIAEGKIVNPAFLFAALLWYPLVALAERTSTTDGPVSHAVFMHAVSQILSAQCRTLAIPRRLTTTMRDIWQLQLRLPRYQGPRALRLSTHPKFRAAYDLLLLRADIEAGEVAKTAAWWQNFQQHTPAVPRPTPNRREKPAGTRTRSRRPPADAPSDDSQLRCPR